MACFKEIKKTRKVGYSRFVDGWMLHTNLLNVNTVVINLTRKSVAGRAKLLYLKNWIKFSPIFKLGFNVNTPRLKLQISNWYRKDFLEDDIIRARYRYFDLEIRSSIVVHAYYRLHNDKYEKFQLFPNCVFRALFLLLPIDVLCSAIGNSDNRMVYFNMLLSNYRPRAVILYILFDIVL